MDETRPELWQRYQELRQAEPGGAHPPAESSA
jgi:hypothetical protein